MDEISRVVTPAPRSEWLRLVDADPRATLFQEPEWTDALCDLTRWRDASRYYETTDGRSYVLPLVRRGPRDVGAVHASMPAGWGMGGLVTADTVTEGVVSSVMSDLQSPRHIGFRVLPNPLCSGAWVGADHTDVIALNRYSHVLDLDGGFENVWNHRFRPTARRNARKALRADLEIDCDSTGRLVPIYRDLFAQSVERWASASNEPHWMAKLRANRGDPPGKLEYLAERLGDRMITMVARHQGEPAAAIIVLTGKSHFYWRGAANADLGQATHASYALQHAAIENACNAGATNYYLGESGQSSGLAHFKERFGAVGHAYPEIRFERVPYTRSNLLVRSAVKRLVGYDTN